MAWLGSAAVLHALELITTGPSAWDKWDAWDELFALNGGGMLAAGRDRGPMARSRPSPEPTCPYALASCAAISARCTLIFTSTRDPSRLMIDMRRSTVNRPRSAWREP